MQHSTTLHPASEWPVLLLNNTYIILIRSDHHRFMISFLGGWLQVFFLFNPFLGGEVGVMGFYFLTKMTTWRFWRFFFPSPSSLDFSSWILSWKSRTSLHHRNLLICETLNHFSIYEDDIWWSCHLAASAFWVLCQKSWGWKNHRSNSEANPSLIDEGCAPWSCHYHLQVRHNPPRPLGAWSLQPSQAIQAIEEVAEQTTQVQTCHRWNLPSPPGLPKDKEHHFANAFG